MNWTRAENVIWEELDGSALLVNPGTGKRWSLNATAAALWKLCDGRLSLAEISASLSRPLDEIAAFCREFAKLGMLAPAPACAAPSGATFRLALTRPPSFKPHGLGTGPRRRPSPTGSSGPA